MNQKPRVMLITGAAGGIGRATVQLFHQKGWVVIGVDRNDYAEVFPNNGLFIQADISDPSKLEEIYQKVRNITDTLDAVVNNAALQVVKPLLETTVEEWDAVMASNLRSVFLGAKLAYPLLKNKGGGAFVNVSSVHAVATSSGVSSYAASKGGLLALTRSMAIEFAGDNIRVNAILPGAVNTPMLSAHLDQMRLENLAKRTVNGRIGAPLELAHAIYFLADEEQSSFMTGQSIVVDGGATAKLSTE
ncbi:MAG: SDR family oxidoreductase [Anaerolineaceae bacterium]|jgi:NAD(P)-dependent dehydrogenase (short-subunit alcohol dehydrogenase family)|nr:SDR family oxidoreductase [Anaerolineaceae bacterium]